MTKLIVLITTLLVSASTFAFNMGDYHNKTNDDSTGCWIQILPNDTSIKADGSCYTEQGQSYNILGLVRTNYGSYEYNFEMNDELYVNKVTVSPELITFKIYNVATSAIVYDEFLKNINGNQVQYYLSYFDFQGNPDVRFDIVLDKEE